MRFFGLPLVACCAIGSFAVAEGNVPQSVDPRIVIELFAEQPQLVTPTGLAVDDKGRVFVAESHTHFRPENYDGPKADRILILEDTDGDGRADARTIFHEGFTHVMDLAFHHDGSLYVATRRDIHRMRDTDGDNRADEVTRIINLETKGDYPHNGISGLAFHLDGRLSFGLGENLGEAYALSGTDGQRFTGGGEGGSTYQVNADGTNLRRVSTGWWNPFGMCVDAFDRVFGTDNDPGASPPCRLIQVIEGGDYGYEYRYGRSGLHPLISWTGTNPGNLPMIAGTGEAPCAILAYESDALPKDYLGQLLVAAWADHRIEHYKIVQEKDKGLVTTKREILIEGHNEFRPVDLALAPDGSVYVTDWVSSSYTLHKLGKIWRIRPKDLGEPQRHEEPENALLSLHRPLREQAARQLVAKLTEKDSLKDLLAKYEDPRVRSALMLAWAANKKLPPTELRDRLLQERDVRLQQLGVRLLGERIDEGGSIKFQREMQRKFNGDDIDPDPPEMQKEKIRLLLQELLRVDFADWKNPPELSVKSAAILAGVSELEGKDIATWRKGKDPLLLHAIVMANVDFNMHPDAQHGMYRRDNRDDFAFIAMLANRRKDLLLPPKIQKERRDEILPNALQYAHESVRFIAIKWIADEQLKEFRPNLVKLLDDPTLDYRSFRAVAAAIDRLDGKPPEDHPAPQFLLDRITAKDPPANLLKLSLREIDPAFKGLKLEHLTALLSHSDENVKLEAVRTLAGHPDAGRFEALIQIATDEKQLIEHRATAIAGLAGGPKEAVDVLLKFAVEENRSLREEALRSLVGVELSQEQRETIEAALEDFQEVRRLLKGSVGERPDVKNLIAWKALLEGEGNPETGKRIFFGAKVGTCSRCHQIEGRGVAVGPDLTQIHHRLQSQGEDPTEWLLKTILRPSEDMAPQYTPWTILTKNGETLTGLPRRKGGDGEAYLGIDGKEFNVRNADIEFHKESNTSIMPADLLQNLTDQELRDLFAFLREPW